MDENELIFRAKEEGKLQYLIFTCLEIVFD